MSGAQLPEALLTPSSQQEPGCPVSKVPSHKLWRDISNSRSRRGMVLRSGFYLKEQAPSCLLGSAEGVGPLYSSFSNLAGTWQRVASATASPKLSLNHGPNVVAAAAAAAAKNHGGARGQDEGGIFLSSPWTACIRGAPLGYTASCSLAKRGTEKMRTLHLFGLLHVSSFLPPETALILLSGCQVPRRTAGLSFLLSHNVVLQ